jgi:hypothetical protein
VKPQEHLPVTQVVPFVCNERITSFSCNDGPLIPDIPQPVFNAEPAVPDSLDPDILLLAEFSAPSMSC